MVDYLYHKSIIFFFFPSSSLIFPYLLSFCASGVFILGAHNKRCFLSFSFLLSSFLPVSYSFSLFLLLGMYINYIVIKFNILLIIYKYLTLFVRDALDFSSEICQKLSKDNARCIYVICRVARSV